VRDRADRVAHLAHHLVGDLGRDALVRAVGGGERRPDAVEELHPRGRLLVDDVQVGELAEGQQRHARALAGGRGDAEVLARVVRVAGPGLQPVVAVAVADRADLGRPGARGHRHAAGRQRQRHAGRRDPSLAHACHP
jgi:hypothetical protein